MQHHRPAFERNDSREHIRRSAAAARVRYVDVPLRDAFAPLALAQALLMTGTVLFPSA